MSYRYDPDLEFLKNCSKEDLETLAEYLNIRDYDRTKDYWIYVAEGFQKLGELSLKDFFIKGSIYYKDILIHICNKLKIKFNSNYPTEKIESCLLRDIKEKPIFFKDAQLEIYNKTMPSCIQIAYIRNKYKDSVNTN